jgi:hypothetical protein
MRTPPPHLNTRCGLLSLAGVGACSRVSSGLPHFLRLASQYWYTSRQMMSRAPTRCARMVSASVRLRESVVATAVALVRSA